MSTKDKQTSEHDKQVSNAQLEQAYTYEEPEDDDIDTEQEEEEQATATKKSRRRNAITDPWAEAMNNISLENIKKLATLDTYTVAGETYKRKMLTPRVRIQLDRLQNESITEQDEEKKMDIVMQQALLCLDGMTKEKFENTDIGHLEQVIGACIMAAKGFRKI